jgi:DNA-3-methyladenine glycosylase II
LPPRKSRPSAATASTRRGAKLDEADRHLRKADPVMRAMVDAHGPLDFDGRRGRPQDAYGALVRSIVGQQLSTKAARTIYERLIAIFDGHTPTPEELIAADPDEIRAAGLSRPKISYLRDLGQHIIDGELEVDRLQRLPDHEVTEQLTAVKGLGRWTADMFLMFHLKRPDILPVGDLGIRRAVERAYGLDEMPAPDELERMAEPWRPHRTLACLYLWESLDNAPA